MERPSEGDFLDFIEKHNLLISNFFSDRKQFYPISDEIYKLPDAPILKQDGSVEKIPHTVHLSIEKKPYEVYDRIDYDSKLVKGLKRGGPHSLDSWAAFLRWNPCS